MPAARKPRAARPRPFLTLFTILAAVAPAFIARPALASTYAAFIPLDSSIYNELEELNDLGLIDSYIGEIKPISRVEAARLTVEAEAKLYESRDPSELARSLVTALRMQLPEEVGWIEQDKEDGLPTMVHPIERLEGEYLYSQGTRRQVQTGANGIDFKEGTPLLPYNDNLATATGSDEVMRWSGWAGVGGFITGYGEGAVAGPLSKDPRDANRAQLLTGAVVVSLGNEAISFGQEEMQWGVGHFNQLSQSANGLPFPALRLQNIHPRLLPGFLRYLGLMRHEAFLGQLDSGRTFSRPWLSGQTIAFRTLPFLEWGIDHTIMFGGAGNDSYSALGFLGRMTGLATGGGAPANTNSRFGLFARVYIPQLRNTQIYAEQLNEDFFLPLGKSISFKLPFKGPSYLAGIYIPALTQDGRTTARFEYTMTDKEYSVHNDSLYWTYDNRLMGNALGPSAWQVNFQIGRWLNYQSKLDVDFFYTSRRASIAAVNFNPPTRNTETSYGMAFDFLHLPVEMRAFADSLGEMKGRTAIEYVSDVNYSNASSMRALVQLSFAFTPGWGGFVWR